MSRVIAPGLRPLLDRLIDYAGMFPPATLTRDIAVASYTQYREGTHGWMLRWLVIGAGELARVSRELDGFLSVLSDADEPRAAAVETKRVARFGRPTYCEVGLADLDNVKRAGGYAKIRTGGMKPEAIPTVDDLAAFIQACADRRLPFKATAGLHHPVRASHPLTYEADPPRAVMHGFLNVFLAACFAWNGDRDLVPILAETDPAAFLFDDRAHWRGRSLDAAQVREARSNFAHSFGSCSLDEPVQGLAELGLL